MSDHLRLQPLEPYRVLTRHEHHDSLYYAKTSEEAEAILAGEDGIIECYIYGIGWARWVPAMREVGK
jgi:hypothetical protein